MSLEAAFGQDTEHTHIITSLVLQIAWQSPRNNESGRPIDLLDVLIGKSLPRASEK